MSDCLFCKFVKGEIPCHKVWEDEKHLAFLTVFPNTPGFTVVITKEHEPSYVLSLPDSVMTNLLLAAKKVAHKIDRAFDDVGRTGLLAEGFGIDHAHVKLFPMHGTADMKEWKPIHSTRREFYTIYPGYIASHDGERADDNELAAIAKRIREA